MSTAKAPGPVGAPCPYCDRYLTMRDARQRRAATTHRAACKDATGRQRAR